ncbi:hypothetical protein ACFLSE_05780 [Bacteroidota bacterium]
MRNLTYVFTLVFILLIGEVHAQVLEDLKAPSMPSATIIGTQINEISKPKTMKALETAILNNYLDSNNNVLVPNSFALEINPFMLTKRQNFNYLEYLNDSLKYNLWRNLSISIASTNNYVINDSIKSNALGFGARTIILNGKVNEKLEHDYKETYKRYKSLLKLASQINLIADDYIEELEEIELNKIQQFALSERTIVSRSDSSIIDTIFSNLPDSTNKKNIVEIFINTYKKYYPVETQEKYVVLIEKYIENYKTFKLDSLRFHIINHKKFKGTKDTIIIKEVFELLPATITKNNAVDNITDVYKETVSSEARDKFKSLINDVKTERYFWRWEIDAAIAYSFPTNDFLEGISPKFGLWNNISYRPPKRETINGATYKTPSNYEFVFLARWIKNNDHFVNKFNPIDTVEFNTGAVFDLGLRGIVELRDFSFEIEYIYRLNSNKEVNTFNNVEWKRTINDNTYKLVFNLNYNISPNVVLSYNIGKNFDMVNVNNGNLISGLTLNIGLGGASKEELIKEALNSIQ